MRQKEGESRKESSKKKRKKKIYEEIVNSENIRLQFFRRGGAFQILSPRCISLESGFNQKSRLHPYLKVDLRTELFRFSVFTLHETTVFLQCQ